MNLDRPYFIGIAGSGMSALAQYLALTGSQVLGSDRLFDRENRSGAPGPLASLGIRIFPQDGSGISPAATCVVYSTAIENRNPDFRKAGALNIPAFHRSEILARLASLKKSIAVAGTSGKSTVAAMLYHILEAARLGPSLITGANLTALQKKGLLGNAAAGAGEWLVFEADESDGSLERYHPRLGAVLNIEKDHKETAELIPLFEKFCRHVTNAVVLNKDDPGCLEIAQALDQKRCRFFGRDGIIAHQESLSLSRPEFNDWDTRFTVKNTPFGLNLPGRHNLMNALASIALSLELGITLETCSRGLAGFEGIERRHSLVGQKGGIVIIDDFAHNPAKVSACIRTVKSMKALSQAGGRIIAIYHPHGYAPMKLFRKELANAFSSLLDDKDILLMPEIYYAGGTADRSISSRDIIEDVCRVKPIGQFFPDKQALLSRLKSLLKPGDIVVNMGARDPGLKDFALKILEGLGPEERT